MRIHWSMIVCGVALGGIAVWACGSDGDNGDLVAANDGGATSSSTSSSSGATSSSGTASGSSSGSSGGGDAGNDAGNDAGSSGALGGDGGVNPPDAGPGGNTTNVACGTTNCAIATSSCCVTDLGGNNISYACAQVDGGCATGGGGGDVAALKCSGQANCASGTVCCVRTTNAGAASECKTSCAGNEAQLCDLKLGDAGGCAPSAPCGNSNIGDWALPSAYATCGDKSN